ncbi:MAG: RluA family pseudouridine synthase [Clostridia bacterium]|nr:RluA family pseudouridine synthase [Clostridia bacterium]
MKTFIITKNDAGQRLDKYITKSMPSLPPSLMYKYIREKRVKVNGKKAVQNLRLNEGDVVDFYIRDEFFEKESDTSFTRLNPNLNVVFEDENILLVDKRPGVIVHSDDKETNGTLIDKIKAYLYKKGEYNPDEERSFVPSLCNRIDRNTGGIVICAKNAEALRCVNDLIKNNEVSKKYLALVHGTFNNKEGHIKNFLLKDSNTNTVKVYEKPTPNALTAESYYTVLKTDVSRNLSLVEVRLVTGRTHQIRAQFSHMGHPLVGDGKYGINKNDKKMGYKFQALYSYKLVFLPKEKDNLLYYLKGREFKVNEVFFEDEIH